MSVLTEADLLLLPMSLRQNGGFHTAAKWYCKGWEPLWYQYDFHQKDKPNFSWMAGIACVSGDTLILLADGSEKRIDSLTTGGPICVMSERNGKFIPALASQPFRKGWADLYEVTLLDGHKIKTTMDHRFLTKNGYVALKELHVGSQIGVLSKKDHSTPGANVYYNSYVTYVSILDIKCFGGSHFYDMVVPDTNNYVGNGIVNHNSGKTTTVAASFLIDCLTTPYFRALNTSVTSKQAELPFEMVMGWIESNPRLEHLIENIQQRPYPTITFKNFSEWVFRTAGRDAQFIRGMEFDRINYDEAGIDFTGEAVKVLRGRLRGKRIDGTTRMGRLDVITSPTSAPWLRERYERGDVTSPSFDEEGYFSMRTTTYDNTHLTKLQIRMMEAEYSDDMIDVELNGKFPDYGASTFPSSHVVACTDQSLNDAMEMALRPDIGKALKGWRNEVHARYGITLFEMPYIPGHVYVLGGDPGTDGPPKRNSPVVIVADVSCKPMKVVYFHWIEGKGAYTPFLTSFKYAITKYHPSFKGIDITGTQKAIDELAFENCGISVDGLSFNRDKEGMINCLIDDVSEHRWSWPMITGLTRQMMSYARAEDRKIAQDIVMVLAEISYLSRFVQEGGYVTEENDNNKNTQGLRHNRRFRTTDNRRRR